MELYDIELQIDAQKIENCRVLSDQEIAEIIKNNDIKTFFKKRRLIKRAKSGIDSIHEFYNLMKNYSEDMPAPQKEFLQASYLACEKKLRSEDICIADLFSDGMPSDILLSNNRRNHMMQLYSGIKLGKKTIEDARRFISHNKELYEEIFSGEVESKKL